MNLDSDKVSLFGICAILVAYLFYIYTLYHSMHRALRAHSKNNSPKVLKEDHKNTTVWIYIATWKVKRTTDITGKIHTMFSRP